MRFSVIAMHFPHIIESTASRMLTESLTRKRLPNMNITAFEDRPPGSAELTAYDDRHLATYLRLLDADEEGADWKEAVKIIFGLRVRIDALVPTRDCRTSPTFDLMTRLAHRLPNIQGLALP